MHDDAALGENQGNHHLRVVLPCLLWQDDPVFNVQALAVSHIDAYALAAAADLLVLIGLSSPRCADLVDWRRQRSLPTIFEINDDPGYIGTWLAADHGMHSPLAKQAIYNIAQACDALQCSSPGLMWRLQLLHPCRHVLDPAVPAPLTCPTKSDGFILGWAGTTTHLDDLLSVMPVVVDFLAAHPEAVFAFMGNPDVFAPALAQLLPSQCRVTPFGDSSAYECYLASLHVGLAPLLDSGFNRCRSDVKFAQYAAAGVVPVLADCAVYADHRDHACLFGSLGALRELLERLHGDRDFLTTRAAAAFDWVHQHRSAQAIRKNMRDIFSTFLRDGISQPPLMPPPWPDGVPEWLAEAYALGRANDQEGVLRVCRQILACAPQCYPARCFAALALSRLQRHAEILSLTDDMPDEPFDGDIVMSLACVAAARCDPTRLPSLLKRLRSPIRRLRLAGGGGDMPGYFRAILAHDPYDYFALFGLMALLRKAGDLRGELPLLLACAELLAPRQVRQLQRASA